MTPLQSILNEYRTASQTEREKGNYFEELIVTYFRYEATYADLYSDVWLYSDWAKEQGLDGRDTGIDLVAKTQGTNEYHAIQCKCYAEDYRVRKADIDSFFTASGKKPFSHRIIVTTTNNWNEHAEDALQNQQPPVNKIDLQDLENSQIEWAQYRPSQTPTLKPKKELRDHQTNALNAVIQGFINAERGKMIMACGTGKTYTSLKIAEEQAGKGKRVLFLVPSLSLLSQTLTEWTQESKTPLHSFAVCSDTDVGKKRKADDDIVQTFAHELRYPATTEPQKLAAEIVKRHDDQHMSVVFSTYHSIEVISKAQHEHGLDDFDLIICDEAHRTTGSTFENESESNFVKVHDSDFIKSTKRLYMTATPRIYGDSAKIKEEQGGVKLCSMDDESLYGKELFIINFSEAVRRGLLCDYKVIVLTVDAAHISTRLQTLLADDDNQLKVDDAAKIVGCWKALSKQGSADDDDGFDADTDPMRRAVAFCQVIEPNTNKAAKTHKVSSKNIAGMFQEVVNVYQEQETDHNTLICEAEHVDGSMNASQKEKKLDWLKAQTPDNTCRILSNVRCLSEGVDVPALDAVLFLTPRNSQVDVVQSVGRVMRNSTDPITGKKKKLGYVILPVVIPTGMSPHEALNDNKTYKVVWDVLQALRSHDDKFDAMVNKLDLIGTDNKKLEVIPVTTKMEITAEVDDVKAKGDKSNGKKKQGGKGKFRLGIDHDAKDQMKPHSGLEFEVGEIERALYAKVVKKCGNRNHWEDWAKDIAKIANTHLTRIKTIISDPNNTKEVTAFNSFSEELRDDLNDSITDEEVVEMLAQHLITKPVFDALFSDYSFASSNPVSKAMQTVLDILQEHRLDKEADTLERFYESVKMRAEGIDNAEGKQRIIVELYDKFFKNAFPRMTERLGIVYTPVEVVDFIIHSVDDLLQQEFGQTLGSKGVHIVDPFTGTGTFITRLLQSGLISKEQLEHKYKNEIHCNEIVLLAYYIAAINIEAVYHSIMSDNGQTPTKHQPFEGICLTDTFQMYEKDDLISELLADNSDRRNRQKSLDIRVIMGNPPYSVGQNDANDNNANIPYPYLDSRIRDTYATHSTATLKNSLYDSYIRAIRWASDRVGDSGIIGFVTNAGFLDGNTADGLRKCLAEDFSSIYIFHLRGNQRTSGERSRKEGGKIFGTGSRAPIAISMLVKNPKAKEHGKIFWHDIGDYLTTKQKLDIISEFKSINGIYKANAWQEVKPNDHNDWVKQRDESFSVFMKMSSKVSGSPQLFNDYSNGVKTNRDSWCYNFSQEKLSNNMEEMLGNYNIELEKVTKDHEYKVNQDPTLISWSSGLTKNLDKKIKGVFNSKKLRKSLYRPFTASWLYYDKFVNDRQGQMPKIFPKSNDNLVIWITGVGATVPFSCWASDTICSIQQGPASVQHFPIYLYKENEEQMDIDLSNSLPQDKGYTRSDGISDTGLVHFQRTYPNESINKEDIFYYTYGLLHSPEYRERYADNLNKELPRIPCVKDATAFWHFSQSGRNLAKLHIDYESIDKYPVTLDCGKRTIKKLVNDEFRVTKMKHPKIKSDGGKSVNDIGTIIYNNAITVRDIPIEAYEYVVNGKAAIEWVMDQQVVSTHVKSGIINDANDWAIETMNNPKYPLELLQRVITVSIETMKIVNNLPKLDID
jgi:predicted helicase